MANDPWNTPFLTMFRDFGQTLNLPSGQVDDVLDHHRKNLQALQDAAQAASAGGQAMMAKQREALETALAEIAEVVQGGGDVSKMGADATALAQKSFEMTVSHASDMAGIAQESGAEVFNILRTRMEESFTEMTGGMMGGSTPGPTGDNTD